MGKSQRNVRQISEDRNAFKVEIALYGSSCRKHPETNNLLIKYGLINFVGNKRNFLRIHAEMMPDYTVNQEEIIFSDNLNGAKKTTLSDNQIHDREWLKNLFDKHSKPYE